MTIAEYLKANNLTLTAFAASIGEGVTTVHGWVNGRRRPGVIAVARIEEVTDGAVRAGDFVPPDKVDA